MAELQQEHGPATVTAVLEAAEELVSAGRALDAVDLLHRTNRVAPEPAIELRLAELRHAAFDGLAADSTHDSWPVPVPGAVAGDGATTVPELRPAELTGRRVREAIAERGCVKVPGLLDAEQVRGFVEGIDHVLALRAANEHRPFARLSSWFAGLPLPRPEAESLGRGWIAGAGGVLACDSPRLLDQLFATYEDLGLRTVIADYLGERPVLSANKCTLRRVPLTANADWHQDGAFLGSGIRALNVWVALTDCGVDAPGMDLLPRRFEAVQETGTGGAIFDWAVGPDLVAQLATEVPVVRPRFRAGDALLFDELFLHRTAVEPTMVNPRHAIESWFFARTGYPDGQVALVW